ncbi:MAG TPA: hypothetical protein VEG38_08430 [Acidimicrobiia bacterium]|nr:hypothetical protein [Acidimicrobiia bacterium]
MTRAAAEPEEERRPATSAAAPPSGGGYWLAGADGTVYPFGPPSLGSLTGKPAQPITGAAATATGRGYWLVGRDGGVFAFGDAGFYGSTGAMRLNQPIVSMAATPTGHGYWLVASDGGIFAFGDAAFYGSMGSVLLNRPITAMSASRTGRGYRFVASDGGLFSFGDAAYAGSAAGRPLPSPIVGMAGSRTGNGYWLVASSGAVYAYGDATRGASASGGAIPAPVVAIMAQPRLPDPSPPPPAAPPAAGAGSGGDGQRSDGADGAAEPPGVPAPGAATAERFQIALIGDTGYTAAQDNLLLRTRTAISSRPYAFVVHDGDIQGQLDSCTDDRLRYVHDVFDGFSMPLVFTPGDNEWADCPDAAQRLDAIRRVFFSTDQSLGQRRIPLTRQPAPFVENARWTAGNVVFATLNVPGPTGRSSGAEGLSAANIAWLNAAFDTAEAGGSPGVMIIWQDDPFNGRSDDDLQRTLIARARRFGKPVVLAHGDTHTYRLGNSWPEAPNLIDLETFALDNTDWWVEVTVDPSSPEVFTFIKQHG